MLEHVKSLLGIGHVDLQAMLVSGLEKLLQFVGAKGSALVSSTFGLIFSVGVMLLAIPMLFTNRTRVASALIEALPVPDADAKRIVVDHHSPCSSSVACKTNRL